MEIKINKDIINSGVAKLGGIAFNKSNTTIITEGKGNVQSGIENIDNTIDCAKNNLFTVNACTIKYLKTVNSTITETESALINMINGK